MSVKERAANSIPIAEDNCITMFIIEYSNTYPLALANIFMPVAKYLVRVWTPFLS